MNGHHRLQIVDHASGISIPALYSLRHQHVTSAVAMLPALGPGWALDIIDDYDGDRTIVVSRAHDPDGTSYVLYGVPGAVHLGRVVRERWVTIGRFNTIESAIRAIAVDTADHLRVVGRAVEPARP